MGNIAGLVLEQPAGVDGVPRVVIDSTDAVVLPERDRLRHLRGRLCYAFNGTGSSNLPCTFSGQSIARGDPAFGDNNYWRGRIWGPHLMILYWALANDDYAGVPGVAEARSALVNQSAALLVQVRGSDDWVWWSSVCCAVRCVCPCGESG